MTRVELRAAAHRLLEFHRRFAPLFGRKEAQGHSTDYVKGLLVAPQGKNVEAMALHVCSGAPGRKEVLAMQRFLTASPWDHRTVQREIQAVFAEELVPSTSEWSIGTVGVIDESGFEKSGPESVGVQRQWCGRLGKKENCQVGVFWIGVTPAGCALLEHQLYLPEQWAHDRHRREKTHVPEEIAFQTKPEIATALHRRITEAGPVRFDWVIGDELYGRNHKFLEELERDAQRYVMEVPANSVLWTADPATQIPAYAGTGRPPKNPQRDVVHSVTQIAAGLPKTAWQMIKLREGAKGPLVFEFARLRVWSMRHNKPGPPVWLLIRRPLAESGELKFYFSNADEQTPIEPMALVTGARWRVEEYLEEGKGELGMADYEARAWPSWHHHMTLVALAHLYVSLSRRDLKQDTPELTLPMALRLLRDALPRPQLDEHDALRILNYHLIQNAIATKSHRKTWLQQHPEAKQKMML